MSDTLPSSLQPDNTAFQSEDEWLEVGKIVGVHGLKGEVKIFPDSDFPERFVQPGPRWLRFPPHHSTLEEVQLIKGRFIQRKGIYVVKFAGIDYRDQADAWQGASVLVQSSDRPILSEGEYYLSDLIGLTVIEQRTKAVVGSVVSLASAGNDLLEIQPVDSSAKTVLVPFVSALVTVVDLDNKIIEISPPQGLIPEN